MSGIKIELNAELSQLEIKAIDTPLNKNIPILIGGLKDVVAFASGEDQYHAIRMAAMRIETALSKFTRAETSARTRPPGVTLKNERDPARVKIISQEAIINEVKSLRAMMNPVVAGAGAGSAVGGDPTGVPATMPFVAARQNAGPVPEEPAYTSNR